ncbi:KxYKxGKxW signal peptide domain-containing protein [Streptococcus tangpeifui]|uniref:KxYKxGKxW signal peptide domain-containing protein n=1 Tax=Streptococcus tangpeifui TaxID=2709400 RepID=UPI0013ECBF9A|nr:MULTISPECIES: KxYKxGKxW signal peptide domain-containing protein [unclassified Streptococcus]
MQEKTHYKLHKVKKHWVTIAVTATAATALFAAGSQASADQVTPAPQEQAAAQQNTEINQADDQKAEQAPVVQQEAPAAEQKPVQGTPEVAPGQDGSGGDQGQAEEAIQERQKQEEQNNQVAEKQEGQVANQAAAQNDQANQKQEAPANNQAAQPATPAQPAGLTIQAPNNSQAANSFNEKNGKWYFLDANKQKVTGWLNINGQRLYFDKNGTQAKGVNVTLDGDTYHFDPDTGEMWTNRFAQITSYDSDNSKYPDWYYFGADGSMRTGWQTIDGREMYFITPDKVINTPYFKRNIGAQVKGRLQTISGHDYYFDPDTGEMLTNTDITIKGITYHLNEDGHATKTTPDHPEDTQQHGHFEQKDFYNDPHSFHYNAWVYIGQDGLPATGMQTINGQKLFFSPLYGEQAINRLVGHDGNLYYFGENGAMVTNQRIKIEDGWIHLSADGTADDGYRRNYDGSVSVYKKDANDKWNWVKTN